MSVLKDPQGLGDVLGFQTYAVRIDLTEDDGSEPVATFFKFGVASHSVRKRFAGEPDSTSITIKKIWSHGSLSEAKAHEQKLFSRYRPHRIFDWPQLVGCAPPGPLHAKGNTELFLADRLNGHENPCRDHALIYFAATFHGHSVSRWNHVSPDTVVYTGAGSPDWLEWLETIPDGLLVLPSECSRKGRVILIETEYLFDQDYFYGGDKKRARWQEEAVRCDTWRAARPYTY